MKQEQLIRLFFIVLVLVPIITAFVFLMQIGKKIYCDLQPFQITPPMEIKPYVWQQTGLITLWFDEAFSSQVSLEVIRLMDKYGFVGALSIPTNFICTKGYASWNEILSLQTKGWETLSQGTSHSCESYHYRNKKFVANEFKTSKKVLERKGLRADQFAIPCGLNEQVAPNLYSMVNMYYTSSRKAGDQINPLPVKNPYHLTSFFLSYATSKEQLQKLIEATKQQKAWLILVFHQIDNVRSDKHLNIKQFSAILDMIKQSRLPVVLPRQALQASYIKENEKPKPPSNVRPRD